MMAILITFLFGMPGVWLSCPVTEGVAVLAGEIIEKCIPKEYLVMEYGGQPVKTN